jgi:hypothetical protein
MLISRRKFTQGAAALSSAAAMPPIPLPVRSGGEDAYSAIVSELVRVEEAAHAAGAGMPGSGAMSATGRQLESFLGHMDLQVNPFETASQVYREMRGFLRDQAKEAAQQMRDEVKRVAEDVVTADKPSSEAQQSSDDVDADKD